MPDHSKASCAAVSISIYIMTARVAMKRKTAVLQECWLECSTHMVVVCKRTNMSSSLFFGAEAATARRRRDPVIWRSPRHPFDCLTQS